MRHINGIASQATVRNFHCPTDTMAQVIKTKPMLMVLE
jgi:hypothetical protein